MYYKRKGGEIMARTKVRRGRRSPMVMHKGEKVGDLQARMKWLLDFLNKDIDSISRIECSKLVLDIAAFIYGPFLEMFPEVNLKPETNLIKEKKFLNICQDRLRFMVKAILTGLKQIGTKPTLGIPLHFDVYVIPYQVFISKRSDGVFKAPLFRGEYFITEDLDVHGETSDFYIGTLADALITLLNHFPLSRIKTCQKPNCGNYFYQKTTKSKGDFCSRKCQNWVNTTRWRENNREDYNAYHRAYQSNQRDKARQEQVEVRCFSCGFNETRGLLRDYLNNYSGSQDCPCCRKAKLGHIVIKWDKDERDWVREPYDEKEWNRYLRETQKREG